MKYLLVAAASLFVLLNSCSEKDKVAKPVNSQNRAEIIKRFNDVNRLDFPTDSLKKYSLKMETASAREAVEYKAMASIAAGIYYGSSVSYQLALKNYENAVKLLIDSDADTLRAYAHSGIGTSYKNRGDYPKATENFYKSLKIFEENTHTKGISMINASLGEVHMQKGDFKSAKEYLDIALKTLENDKSQSGWLRAAHTLANLHGMNGNFEAAMKIDEEGIRISDSIKSPRAKVTFLDNKANCFLYSKRFDSAEYYFKECLKVDIQTGNKKQIADTYSNLGNLAGFQGDYKKGEDYTMKSIAILKPLKHTHNLAKSYMVLVDIYSNQGDYKRALSAHEAFYEEYKKMIDEKKESSLAEFRILHETDKKEKLLAENKIELLQKNAEVRQRNNIVIVLLILAVFIAMIGFLIYRQQKLKNSQLAQEHELKTAIAQIETQNRLQNQRLDISRDLHDNIGAQLTFIISSIDNIKYAFDISNSKLGNKLQSISTFAKETIIELRDTIWAMNHSEISFEDLRTRVLNFMEKAKEATGNINFTFTISEQLSAIMLTSIEGMNVFRTIQEAVNNSLKYSGATQITIEISEDDEDIIIGISDNGSGFNNKTVERGFGLRNIEKRISDIGGKFLIDSDASGTRINLVLSGKLDSGKA